MTAATVSAPPGPTAEPFDELPDSLKSAGMILSALPLCSASETTVARVFSSASWSAEYLANQSWKQRCHVTLVIKA
jgi:hypothetical protein